MNKITSESAIRILRHIFLPRIYKERRSQIARIIWAHRQIVRTT